TRCTARASTGSLRDCRSRHARPTDSSRRSRSATRSGSRSPCNGIPSGTPKTTRCRCVCSARSATRCAPTAGRRRASRSRSRKSMRRPEVQTFSDLERWLDSHGVTEVECLVPDLTGVARGKILPRERFTEERGMRLPEGTVALSVTGEVPRGGPYWDVIHDTDPDMHLRPDPTTVRIVPWATDPTAQVIHDCYDSGGKLVPFAPRSVLRRVCKLYESAGWSPVVAPEVEFYLVSRNSDPDIPLKAPVGRSGRPETSRQSYSID